MHRAGGRGAHAVLWVYPVGIEASSPALAGSRRAFAHPWAAPLLVAGLTTLALSTLGTAENAGIARETYRPDLYRSALKPLGVALPVANAKVEGALRSATPVGSAGASLTLGPDGFFDGGLFDPDQLDGYIAGQKR